VAEIAAYEDRVRASFDSLLHELDGFFMQTGAVHQSLRELTRRLDEAQIPYAVVGALALGFHGLVRATVDIDVLLTREGLAKFRELYLGLGYVTAFPGAAKSFRDADTGVRIDVITTGEYPGDGLPKPVRFADPADVSVELEGTRVLALERFIELKLASGMTAPHRRRDLSDVQDLIRAVKLPGEFADRLDSSVQPLYRQLWEEAQATDRVVES
jgi:hypothetical protein